eukprot:952521-Prymnesium_polylepis.1
MVVKRGPQRVRWLHRHHHGDAAAHREAETREETPTVPRTPAEDCRAAPDQHEPHAAELPHERTERDVGSVAAVRLLTRRAEWNAEDVRRGDLVEHRRRGREAARRAKMGHCDGWACYTPHW